MVKNSLPSEYVALTLAVWDHYWLESNYRIFSLQKTLVLQNVLLIWIRILFPFRDLR